VFWKQCSSPERRARNLCVGSTSSTAPPAERFQRQKRRATAQHNFDDGLRGKGCTVRHWRSARPLPSRRPRWAGGSHPCSGRNTKRRWTWPWTPWGAQASSSSPSTEATPSRKNVAAALTPRGSPAPPGPSPMPPPRNPTKRPALLSPPFQPSAAALEKTTCA